MDNIIGENIRRHRVAKPWTQEQLAGAAQVDVRTVLRTEAGKPISAESLQAIAGALDVPVDVLTESLEEQAAKKVRAEVKAKYIDVPLGVIDRARDLSVLVSGSHALYFNIFDAATDEHEDAAAELKQLISDWLNVYDELPPVQQRDCDKSLQSEIDRLRAMGFAVTAGVKRVLYKLRSGGEPMQWQVLAVAVSRAESPRTVALLDKKGPF